MFDPSTLPTFSLVFETENLSSVELENIYRSLSSLAAQTIPMTQAQEFMIIDGGYAPEDVIQELCTTYPWIQVHQAPGIGYNEAKMMGANLSTGEIVLFCDSDCEYNPEWLSNILTTFVQNPEVSVVAGETTTPIRNPYELAIAINYFFPRLSHRQNPYESREYYLNNVGFRRDFLIENPVPCNIPLYRGNCNIHSYILQEILGDKILKHPQAIAVHEPPTFAFTFFWRYLVMGRDQVINHRLKAWIKTHLSPQDITLLAASSSALEQTLYHSKSSLLDQLTLSLKLLIKRKKLNSVMREDPRRWLLFPLILPLILWLDFLYLMGSLITYFRPELLLKVYQQQESDESTQRLVSQPSH